MVTSRTRLQVLVFAHPPPTQSRRYQDGAQSARTWGVSLTPGRTQGRSKEPLLWCPGSTGLLALGGGRTAVSNLVGWFSDFVQVFAPGFHLRQLTLYAHSFSWWQSYRSGSALGGSGVKRHFWSATCFCVVFELKTVFTFLKGFKNFNKGEYFMTCKNCMRFQFWCPNVQLYWNMAVFIQLCLRWLFATVFQPSSCGTDPRAPKA